MEPENENSLEFIDAEAYRPAQEEPLTYKMIVLRHIQRCVTEGSKEMCGGYFKEKRSTHGVIQEYIPDQRQVYMQCIMSLHDVLLPFFDSDMKKDIIAFNASMEKLVKDINDSLRRKAFNEREKSMVEAMIQAGYIDNDSIEFKKVVDEKLVYYRILFQKLILLFHRKGCLMDKVIED